MSLTILTYQQREANKKERAEILDLISRIQNTETLHRIALITSAMAADEVRSIPLPLDEFVDMLDFPMLVRLMDLFKNESSQYLCNEQIKELVARAMNSYMGIEEEEEIAEKEAV